MENESPIMLLKNDHRAVEKMFSDFKSAAADDERESLVKKICSNLEAHAKIEEEYFYPEVENTGEEGEELIAESRNEHNQIKEIIAILKDMPPADPDYERKVSDLEQAVSHHVQEEEQEVFSFAEENIPDKLGIGMAAKMMAVKSKEKLLG